MVRIFSVEIEADDDEYDLIDALRYLAGKVAEVNAHFIVRVDEDRDRVFTASE